MSFDYQVEDKRTLTIAAESTSPCNMDEDLLLPSNLDDLNPLRHFDPVLDVTDTETIPIPSLDNIEPEKLSLGEKLPLDEEMEVVVKPDHELEMLATPDLPDTLPSFAVMDRHLSQPKAPVPNYYHHRNSYFTPPKVAGKRKFTGKIKVCVTNYRDNALKSGTLSLTLSDHLPIYVSLKSRTIKLQSEGHKPMFFRSKKNFSVDTCNYSSKHSIRLLI